MSDACDLTFEINKLIKRHELNELKIVCEIMDSYEKLEDRKKFALILNNFNNKIEACDILFSGYQLTDHMNQRKGDSIILELCTNELYERIKFVLDKRWYEFFQLYEKLYQEKMQDFIKQLWTAIPGDGPVVGAEQSFKNIFEDLYDNVLVKYPTLFIKRLKDVGTMYRCRSWNVNNDYDLMIPNKIYVKDNRWNPDGVAYLYLSCGDEHETFDGIVNMVQKTCFEEIRLVDGSEVAICQFKSLKKDAKIINLCYEEVDLIKLLRDFYKWPKEWLEIILGEIYDTPELEKEMRKLIVENTNYQFAHKTETKSKKLIKETELEMKITELEMKINELVCIRIGMIMLALFDKSIFEVVDKATDPKLKAYLPFREFCQLLIRKGYDGIIYRSTRMNMLGLAGKNLVIFDKMNATYKEGSMKKYKYSSGKYAEFN